MRLNIVGLLKKFLPKKREIRAVNNDTTVEILRILEISEEPRELKEYRIAYSEVLCQDCGRWDCTCD